MLESILEKVSYHAVYDDSIMDALGYAEANGFAGVQIAVETPHLSFETLSEAECSEIAQFRALKQLSISLHAPDDATSLFQTSRYLSEGIFNYFDALFTFAERIGAKLITFHPGAMTTFRTDGSPEEVLPRVDMGTYRETFEKNLQRLIHQARGRFVMCIENYRMDIPVLEVVQPHLDAGELSLCWDLGKTFDGEMNRDEQLEEYFWSNVDHVRQVHLHDIRSGLSHRVIGSGELEFMHFLPRLAQAEVLEYCIEVRPREKATESLANLKELIRGHETPNDTGRT